jgi:hypothetical protein
MVVGGGKDGDNEVALMSFLEDAQFLPVSATGTIERGWHGHMTERPLLFYSAYEKKEKFAIHRLGNGRYRGYSMAMLHGLDGLYTGDQGNECFANCAKACISEVDKGWWWSGRQERGRITSHVHWYILR